VIEFLQSGLGAQFGKLKWADKAEIGCELEVVPNDAEHLCWSDPAWTPHGFFIFAK
jgi:hypothetical protein